MGATAQLQLATQGTLQHQQQLLEQQQRQQQHQQLPCCYVAVLSIARG
jgi:hypothetical protein